MLKRPLKKLYGKLASVRDYEFAEAKKLGGIQFTYRGKVMTIKGNDLYDKQFQCHKQFWKTTKSGWVNPLTGMNGYTLVDFVFVPDGGQDAAKSSKRIKSAGNRAGASESPKKTVEAELFGGLDARKVTHV
jgi:hypothetical protein